MFHWPERRFNAVNPAFRQRDKNCGADYFHDATAISHCVFGAHVYIKTADFSDFRGYWHAEVFDQIVKRFACLDAVAVNVVADFHLEGVAACVDFACNVRLHVFNCLFALRNYRWQAISFSTPFVALGVVRAFQAVQSSQLPFKACFFTNGRIIVGQCHYVCKTCRLLTDIVYFFGVQFTAKEFIHHVFFVHDFFPHVGVVAAFGHVGENFDFLVQVAGTQNSTFALFNVTRSPRTIQMVKCNQMFLKVRARAHLLGWADYHANFTVIDAVEKVLSLLRIFRVVHKGNLIGGNAALNQTLLDSLVNGNVVGGNFFFAVFFFAVFVLFFAFRNAQVRKN